MKTSQLVLGAALAIAAAVPLAAHHSFAAEFDVNKPGSLTGAVTRIEWGTPHIWVYLDVKDEHGAAQPWQCEGGAPNTLTRNGWSKDSLKPTEQITIESFLAKDGSKTCNLRIITMPNGLSVFAGSSAPDAPPPPKKWELT